MAYASQSLGSMPFGGLSGGAGNPTPDTVEIVISINAPAIRIYSEGGTLPAYMTVNAPIPTVIPDPASPLALNLTLYATVITASPDTLQLSITPLQPSIDSTGEVSAQPLVADIPAPTPMVTGVIQTVVSAAVTAEQAIPTPTATPSEVQILATVNIPVTGTSAGGLTQQLIGTLNAPIPRIYSLPGTFAATIEVLAPIVAVVSEPSDLDLALALSSPLPTVDATPAEQALIATLEGATPVIIYPGTTLNALLTVNAPTPVVSKRTYLTPLTISAGFSPTIGSLQPYIVRYIYDPIVTGGCPQCGTFMYEVNGTHIPGTVIKQGRNFDIDKGLREDRYWKCGRCGYVLHQDRAIAHPDGSRSGWGMKYDEIRADAPGDA